MLQSSTVEEEEEEEEEEDEHDEEPSSSCCSGDGRLRFLLDGQPFLLPVPSQSPQETHPLPLYTLSGLLGMLEGRCPLLLHSYHFFWLVRVRGIEARASA